MRFINEIKLRFKFTELRLSLECTQSDSVNQLRDDTDCLSRLACTLHAVFTDLLSYWQTKLLGIGVYELLNISFCLISPVPPYLN